MVKVGEVTVNTDVKKASFREAFLLGGRLVRYH